MASKAPKFKHGSSVLELNAENAKPTTGTADPDLCMALINQLSASL